MTIVAQSTHDLLVREVAERYVRQGFSVQVEPGPSELPSFLHGFQPDLIVTTPEGKIVVEVKTHGRIQQSSKWQALKDVIEANEGWKFQLVMDNRRERELRSLDLPVLSREEVGTQLHASRQLADSGQFGAALIVAWATIEALLRKASRDQGISLPDQGPGPLITALYLDGNLSRAEFDTLMTTLNVRNNAAHGFQTNGLDRNLFDEVYRIAEDRLAKNIS